MNHPLRRNRPVEEKEPMPVMFWVVIGLLPIIPIVAVISENLAAEGHGRYAWLQGFCFLWVNAILSFTGGYGLTARSTENILIRLLGGLTFGVGFFLVNVTVGAIGGCMYGAVRS